MKSRILYLPLASALLVALVVGVFIYNAQSRPVMISQDDLLQEYGVQVKLIALTNLGGTIDFRLSILDAQKASVLLGDRNILPTLYVDSKRIQLKAPPTGHKHHHDLKDGNLYLLFFPNPHYVVHPGTHVNVQFGELRVEAVEVQ